MKGLAVGLLLFSCVWVSVNAQCASTQRTVTPVGKTAAVTAHYFTATNWAACINAAGMTFAADERVKALGLLDAVETAVRLHSFTDLSKSYSQATPRNFTLQVRSNYEQDAFWCRFLVFSLHFSLAPHFGLTCCRLADGCSRYSWGYPRQVEQR
jgi:hypothetical protein